MSKFSEKICKIISPLLDTVDYSERETKIVFDVETQFQDIRGDITKEKVKNFCSLFDIKYFIFGSYGECGKVIFMDTNLKVILSLAFEDGDNGTRSFIIK